MTDELDRLRRRVDELEAAAAFSERTVSRLDEVVREFSARVERLEQDLRRLRAEQESPPEESPPDD